MFWPWWLKEKRDARNLFGLSTDEGYYKSIKTNSAFNSSYVKGDKKRMLTIKECLDMIRPCLRDIINDHETQGEWKIQSAMAINFTSSKDSDEILTICSKKW